MNLGLVTSYIIAALLTLSIIMMNLRLSSSSTELTLTQITRQHVITVADMINDDFHNMGYNVYEKTDPILTVAEEHKISFYRNIENDPARDPELITWEFYTGNPVALEKNPNLMEMTRTVEDPNSGTIDITEIATGVSKFILRYYDEHGAPLDEYIPTPLSAAEMENVKQIYLELEVQSMEPLVTRGNSNGRFIRSVYEKRFSPRNLE
jgi:hypothetical protein